MLLKIEMIRSSNSSDLVQRVPIPIWTSCKFLLYCVLGKIFNSISNDSPSIPNKSVYPLGFWICCDCSLHLSISSGCLCIFPRHRTESEKKCIFAFDNLINLSCRTVDLIQGVNCNSVNENVSDLVLLDQDEFTRDVQERLECPEVGFPVDDQLLIVIRLYRYFHWCWHWWFPY